MADPQAFVRVLPRGGTRNSGSLLKQLEYIAKKHDPRWRVVLLGSARHQNVELSPDEFRAQALAWAEGTGNFNFGQSEAESQQDLTTHIVVSFPPQTDSANAHAAARAWAERMFGGDANGDGGYDYVSALHVDREHVHIHFIINRRGDAGSWLRISSFDPWYNHLNMREILADISTEHGIHLAATSRQERGLIERPLTVAEYRRRQREAIKFSGEGNDSARATPEPPPLPNIPFAIEGINQGSEGAGPGPRTLENRDRRTLEQRSAPTEPSDGFQLGGAASPEAAPAEQAQMQDIRHSANGPSTNTPLGQENGEEPQRGSSKRKRGREEASEGERPLRRARGENDSPATYPIETRNRKRKREDEEREESARRRRRGEPEPPPDPASPSYSDYYNAPRETRSMAREKERREKEDRRRRNNRGEP